MLYWTGSVSTSLKASSPSCPAFGPSAHFATAAPGCHPSYHREDDGDEGLSRLGRHECPRGNGPDRGTDDGAARDDGDTLLWDGF